MERNNNMDDFLRNKMSVEESGIAEPSLGLTRHARELVNRRKSRQEWDSDIFLSIAEFLNLHVRLSYVVIVIFCLGLGSVYFVREESGGGENITSPSVVNIASARSTTVLSSIVTFESRH